MSITDIEMLSPREEDPDPLLPPADVARRALKSEATLARYRRLGIGPSFVRLGRAISYRRSAVDRWLAENEFASTRDYARRSG